MLVVLGLVTPLHAICFAVVCSTAGIGLLYFGANGVAASLGALNLVLYTCVYTPMKRVSSLNTWVGAVGEYRSNINALAAKLKQKCKRCNCFTGL